MTAKTHDPDSFSGKLVKGMWAISRYVDFSFILQANYTAYLSVLYLFHVLLLIFVILLLGYAFSDNWFFNYLVEKKELL